MLARSRFVSVRTLLIGFVAMLVAATPARAGCPGDCAQPPNGAVDIALDENALFEPHGVTGAGPPIDWNANGNATETATRNVNCPPTNGFGCGGQQLTRQSCGTSGSCGDGVCSVINDHADWTSVQLSHLDDPDDDGVGETEVVHCIRTGAIIHAR